MSSHKLTQRLFPRALKLLPLAALLAAPQVWADSNGTTQTAGAPINALYAGGASGNNVTVDTKPGSRANGDTWDNAAGGYASGTDVTGNTLTIANGGEVTYALGGYCDDCSATGNNVVIEEGATVQSVYGGYVAYSNNPNIGATRNTVTFGCNVTAVGDVMGGHCNSTSGAACGSDLTTGNALDACDTTVGGGGNFEKIICRPKSKRSCIEVIKGGSFDTSGVTELEIDDSALTPELKPGEVITPIVDSAGTPIPFPASVTPTFTTEHYYYEPDGSGGLRVKTVNRLITVEASPAEGGNVTCTAPVVTGSSNKYKVADGGELTCTAKPNEGYGLTGLTLKLLSGSGWTCDESTLTCTLTGITKDMTATVNFTKGGGAPGTPGTPGVSDTFGSGGTITGTLNPDGSVTYTGGSCPTGDCGNNSSPAMGELGLLLSGLALAGAAAPALRRRKQGKKG